AVGARVGHKPEKLKPAHYSAAPSPPKPVALMPRAPSELVGIDVYVEWPSADPNTLAAEIVKTNGDGLELSMISNRGVKVWPGGMDETFCTDSFRCRFQGNGVTHDRILG